MEARYNETVGILKNTIQEGIDSREFRGDINAEEVAAILFDAADGMTFHFATSGVNFNWHRMNQALLDTMLNGILKR
jgi:hypothetical protein